MTQKTLTAGGTMQAPRPPGHWLLGHIPAFRKDILGTVAQATAKYGDVVRFRLGPLIVHLVAHPDLAQEVLVQHKHNFPTISSIDKPRGLQLLLGQGLLTNGDHESWLSQRRMMQPMFHRQRIATMVTKMTTAGERLLNRWQQRYPPGTTVNVAEEMMRVTLDIINQTMFSTDVMDHAGEVGEALTVGIRFSFRQNQNPLSLPLSWPTPENQQFKAARATLDRVIYGIIAARRASGESHGDLLDMLLEARDEDTGAAMSDQQLRDEVLTIFGAGHETTANALAWTWYLLAQNPRAAQLLRAELDQVLNGRVPTMADLPNLPYTQAVFDEAMRLYPPAPLLLRNVTQDTTLGGYHVPAQSRLMISIYSIHRHPDFWEQPTTFMPERFLPDQKQGRHRMAYMPFGGGPHMCIGNNFALIEGQLLLALIAQRYDLQLVAERPVEPEVAITMRPRTGLWMRLQPRG